MIEIRAAHYPDDAAAVDAIFREYIASPTVSLAFQDYEAELAALPGKYAAPRGRLLLAWRDARVVGCAAFREVDATTCEMKRVYVRPEARGTQLGRQLVERLLRDAKAAGYARMCLDVLPEFEAARRLYESLGFTPAPPVTFNPVPGTAFLGRDL
ncbi:GNAT family N-acetyltransferase [Burkholderia stagnalis]|uniref:GNAT family N-acetyltransferase n=1 Tax=Burkholderia stagnalis TaxID=1503054 RepID=UPI00075DC880|nr:GNAT family N-acetyltransferase [Burkholderia stagnalis]KVL86457.1 acetyltransferase [Burkholderia stagnalis]KVL92650.1 acetyltransferase [Burkholderia stagnalis]KVM12062.1 acetyltransferase [Burkholderia stagnalis]KVM89272.1 acetyltransferase [Burkholderia stagnalis]KVN66529.1 acetyltransferase [Burkholderia stagnalis]